MIPVSTSVLMVLLKPLLIFQLCSVRLVLDHVKVIIMNLRILNFNDLKVYFPRSSLS